MEKDSTEELYNDFLNNKVVEAKELVSMINAISNDRFDSIEDFKEYIIGLIYSHAK